MISSPMSTPAPSIGPLTPVCPCCQRPLLAYWQHCDTHEFSSWRCLMDDAPLNVSHLPAYWEALAVAYRRDADDSWRYAYALALIRCAFDLRQALKQQEQKQYQQRDEEDILS